MRQTNKTLDHNSFIRDTSGLRRHQVTGCGELSVHVLIFNHMPFPVLSLVPVAETHICHFRKQREKRVLDSVSVCHLRLPPCLCDKVWKGPRLLETPFVYRVRRRAELHAFWWVRPLQTGALTVGWTSLIEFSKSSASFQLDAADTTTHMHI